MAHNGPGTPLEPCVLLNLEQAADSRDPHSIEVWTVKYFSDPSIIQLRAFPCVCSICNGHIFYEKIQEIRKKDTKIEGRIKMHCPNCHSEMELCEKPEC